MMWNLHILAVVLYFDSPVYLQMSVCVCVYMKLGAQATLRLLGRLAFFIYMFACMIVIYLHVCMSLHQSLVSLLLYTLVSC